jgi:hypothetical protein
MRRALSLSGSKVSRLLIMNSAGKAYSGKEVLLIAGRPSYYLVLSECIYT